MVRVWVINDETPGSATKEIYQCTRLQEYPESFHVLSRIGTTPHLVVDPGVSSLMAHTLTLPCPWLRSIYTRGGLSGIKSGQWQHIIEDYHVPTA